jgi:predicted RNA-binding protein YlxR (DUF448 family)
VHPDAGCVDAAVRKRAFGRALRTAITDTTEISRWAESQMDK